MTRLADVLLGLVGVAAVAASGQALALNAATAVVAFFLLVLALSVWRGLTAGVVGSLAGAACFNYFFIPPVGTFTVADPENWVALGSFLAASTVSSRLVVTARARADEAEARRREVEGLYELSLDLFAATNRVGALGEAAGRALRSLGAEGGELVLGSDAAKAPDPVVDSVWRRGELLEVPVAGGARDVYLPLLLGGRSTGVLVVRRVRAGRAALDSVARLVALAVERESLLGERSHLEALRESDRLKTSLLRAVSHDLRSPLTGMRLGLGSLRRLVASGSRDGVGPALDEVERETERLNRRIDNLLALARLEAGVVVPRPEPIPAGDLFRSVREALGLLLTGKIVTCRVEADCPDLLVDPSLALEILVNLLENSARVSPQEAPVELSATRHPMDERRVRVEILDRGPGIAVRSATTGAEPDCEGTPDARRGGGLGLEIAGGLAAACDASVRLLARTGGGTIARVDFRAAPRAEGSEA